MSGSTLLSCATSLKLDLIKLHPRLGVPPPRAKIITSQADQTLPAAKRVTQGKVVFDEMQSTVQEPSVKPLTVLFRGLLQPCTGAPFKRELSVIEKQARYQNDQHDELSSMVPKSILDNCPIWPPFEPLMAPFRGPLQPHTGALLKRELSVIEKQTRYQNNQHDETSPMVPRSAPYDCPIQPLFKPLTAPYRSPIQKRTVGHRKMSQVSKWSGQWAESIGKKISPIWLPCTGPVQASYGPVQRPLIALFKGEWLITQKPDKYQNDQHDKKSTVVPESAPYDCPIWALFKPLMAQFKIPLQSLTAPFKGDNFPMQHHKIHQNVQLNKQRKMHPLRPPEHSQQLNQQHSKQYVQSLRLLEDPEALDMENAQGLWIWFL